MDCPFTKPIHHEILKHLAKGERPKDLEKLTGETYSNIKFLLAEMRELADVNTNIELGFAVGATVGLLILKRYRNSIVILSAAKNPRLRSERFLITIGMTAKEEKDYSPSIFRCWRKIQNY
jgi:hypothetical protein